MPQKKTFKKQSEDDRFKCLVVLSRGELAFVRDLLADAEPQWDAEGNDPPFAYHSKARFDRVWKKLLVASERGPWDWESTLEEVERD